MGAKKKEPSTEIQFVKDGANITLIITRGDKVEKIVMQWITACCIHRDLDMALSFGHIRFKEAMQRMIQREEARRLAKEAKRAAKQSDPLQTAKASIEAHMNKDIPNE